MTDMEYIERNHRAVEYSTRKVLENRRWEKKANGFVLRLFTGAVVSFLWAVALALLVGGAV